MCTVLYADQGFRGICLPTGAGDKKMQQDVCTAQSKYLSSSTRESRYQPPCLQFDIFRKADPDRQKKSNKKAHTPLP